MRVNNVIIITSGMSDIATHRRLEILVRELFEAKKKPVLVLGPDGDEFLLNSRGLEECELVFDPNFSGGLFSSIKAGLHAIHSASIVVSLGASRPDTVSRLLQYESDIVGDGSALNCDLALPASDDFFVVTAKGLNHLRKLPATSPWPSADLSVLHEAGPEPLL